MPTPQRRHLARPIVTALCGAAAALAACRHSTVARPAVAAPASGNSHLVSGRWLRILATNDFHGALEPRRDATGVLRGGAAALAAEIARARAECRPPACVSILLDGGDEFQGTPASNFEFGRPVVELFNHLGYAAAALGNHEFDWGTDTLRARMRGARYRILGANVTDSAGRDVAWIPDDTIVHVGSLRLGIVGIATPATPVTTRPSHVAGLRFAAPAPVVDAHARSLRARGAQMVVVVAHEGAFCDRPATACQGEIVSLARDLTGRVDAIVSGHTHSPVATVVRGIPIVQARSSGIALGVMDVAIGGSAAPVVALRDVLPDSTGADPAVDSLVRRWTAAVSARVSRPVARIGARLTRAALGDLIADAQRAAGQGDVAVMNAGGVRAALDSGVATYGRLFEVQPFGNELTRQTVRGSDLRAYLQRIVSRPAPNAHLSGVVVTIDSARAIRDVRLADGAPLDDQRPYRLVLSDFLAAGGDDLAVPAARSETLGIVDLDALIAWLQSRPQPVRAPDDARIVLRRVP
jgi:5'-nucleotidase